MDEMLDRLVYKNEASGLTYVAEIRKCAPQCCAGARLLLACWPLLAPAGAQHAALLRATSANCLSTQQHAGACYHGRPSDFCCAWLASRAVHVQSWPTLSVPHCFPVTCSHARFCRNCVVRHKKTF